MIIEVRSICKKKELKTQKDGEQLILLKKYNH